VDRGTSSIFFKVNRLKSGRVAGWCGNGFKARMGTNFQSTRTHEKGCDYKGPESTWRKGRGRDTKMAGVSDFVGWYMDLHRHGPRKNAGEKLSASTIY